MNLHYSRFKHVFSIRVENSVDSEQIASSESIFFEITNTIKPALRGHSKRRPKIGYQDRLSNFIKLPFVFKAFVLSIFERPLQTGLLYYLF